MKMNRRNLLRGAGGLSALAALGIRPDQVMAAEDGILLVRFSNDPNVLDPGYMIGSNDATVQFAVLPRLALPVRGEDGVWTWMPSDLVESLTQDDDLHISFTLKPGFEWSGGYGDVNAEDVKFSYERILESDWSSRFPTLERVDVHDEYSGTIVFNAPFGGVFLLGIANESGTIISKAAMEAQGITQFTTELPAHCGPYVIADWRRNERMILRRNPDWPGSLPDFDEIRLVIVPDLNIAELALEAGDVMVTEVVPETASRYAENPPPGITLSNLEGGNLYTWMGMNTEHPLLEDIRVRKAIQRAVDVDSILVAAYGGVSPKAFGIIPPGTIGHRESAGYTYDPDEARALMAEAGVSGLTLELQTLGDGFFLTAAQIIQANLADIGITVEITPVEAGRFWNLGLESQGEEWRDLQIWLMRYRTTPEPSDAISWFVSSQVGIWNWERWTDPEFDRLYDEGITETDLERRQAIYERMQEIMDDTGAYLYITHDVEPVAHVDTVQPAFQSGGGLLPNLTAKA